jgi:hypothetical protein
MTRITSVLLALLAVSAVPDAVQAQATGKWTLELGEWKSEAGAGIQIRMAPKGNLVLNVTADSLTGTWLSEGAPETALANIHGRSEGKSVKLAGTRNARVNINGEESTVEVKIWFDLTVSGDEVSGTMKLQNPQGPPVMTEVKGRRTI